MGYGTCSLSLPTQLGSHNKQYTLYAQNAIGYKISPWYLEDKEEIGLILRDNTQASCFFYQSGHWTKKHSMPTSLIKQMGSFYKIILHIPFCLQLTQKQADKDYFLLNNAKFQVFYQRLWARLLRWLESSKRQFSKTQFWWYIWLGNVCRITFLIP